MMKAAQDLNPDEICILGDFADFYSVSSHSKDPRIFNLLVDEVSAVCNRLDEIDKLFPKAKKVFLEGNHENRLNNILINNINHALLIYNDYI